MKSNSESKIEPWEHLHEYFRLEVCPLTTTFCFIFLRKSSKIFSKLPDMPLCFN